MSFVPAALHMSTASASSKGQEKSPSSKDEFVILGVGDEKAASTDPKMAKLPVNLNFNSPVVREWLARRRQEIRPWSDFVKMANFEVPKTVPRASNRVVKNLEHFQSNYVSLYISGKMHVYVLRIYIISSDVHRCSCSSSSSSTASSRRPCCSSSWSPREGDATLSH